jgi:hypothetical protein
MDDGGGCDADAASDFDDSLAPPPPPPLDDAKQPKRAATAESEALSKTGDKPKNKKRRGVNDDAFKDSCVDDAAAADEPLPHPREPSTHSSELAERALEKNDRDDGVDVAKLAPPYRPMDDGGGCDADAASDFDDSLAPPPPLDDAKQPKRAATAESEAPPTVIILGCKYVSPGGKQRCPDTLRLDEVARMYTYACVLGCSEFAAIPPGCTSHINSYFKRSLIDALARAPSVLLLDYFWLQCNYYESNYGMNWLSTKCHAAFAPGSSVDAMILPVDVGGNMRAMLTTHPTLPNGVTMELISAVEAEQHHPLVRATLSINSKLINLSDNHDTCRGRFHEAQIHRLDPMQPFVVIHRISCDWRTHLALMLVCR